METPLPIDRPRVVARFRLLEKEDYHGNVVMVLSPLQDQFEHSVRRYVTFLAPFNPSPLSFELMAKKRASCTKQPAAHMVAG
jgi:hypothetical protein